MKYRAPERVRQGRRAVRINPAGKRALTRFCFMQLWREQQDLYPSHENPLELMPTVTLVTAQPRKIL